MNRYKKQAINKVIEFSKTSRYSYNFDTIERATEKMDIYCSKHGIFKQAVRKHLMGQNCPKCSTEKTNNTNKKNTEQFIFEAKKEHMNLYSYRNTVYISSKDKVKITCELHGDFEQAPFKHLQGQGCKFCKQAYHDIKWFGNNIHKAYSRGIIYLIRIYNEAESFYKVGITATSIERRYSGSNMHNDYKIEIIDYIEGTRISSYVIEQNIHKNNKNIKYCPKNKFVGHTECYTKKIDIRNKEWKQLVTEEKM